MIEFLIYSTSHMRIGGNLWALFLSDFLYSYKFVVHTNIKIKAFTLFKLFSSKGHQIGKCV